MEDHELTAVLEAILFVSGEPIPVKRLAQVLEGVAPDRIQSALARLQETHNSVGRGLQIVEIAGGYQITTRPECGSWVRALEKIKSATKLSRSALDTLAIIAYKQPVTRGEVELIRGVDSAGVLKTMLERRIVKMVGRREGLGRPILYGTTQEFLKYFGLRDLSELPALKELKEIVQAPAEYEREPEPEAATVNGDSGN